MGLMVLQVAKFVDIDPGRWHCQNICALAGVTLTYVEVDRDWRLS